MRSITAQLVIQSLRVAHIVTLINWSQIVLAQYNKVNNTAAAIYRYIAIYRYELAMIRIVIVHDTYRDTSTLKLLTLNYFFLSNTTIHCKIWAQILTQHVTKSPKFYFVIMIRCRQLSILPNRSDVFIRLLKICGKYQIRLSYFSHYHLHIHVWNIYIYHIESVT